MKYLTTNAKKCIFSLKFVINKSLYLHTMTITFILDWNLDIYCDDFTNDAEAFLYRI